ncbi:MAG TPA: putative Ig domain-containing protein [Bryobacteraceae bacterium]|nr:putative Ig domain-containing protein [Bryobacteraceae bacterium]
MKHFAKMFLTPVLCALTMIAQPLRIQTTSVPNASPGIPYDQALQAGGGTPPYAWSLAAGSLPNGIALTMDGSLSGTPSAPGMSRFTVSVTDSAKRPASDKQALTLSVDDPPLRITTLLLPPATAGAPYSQAIGASGGTPPYSWSVSGGSLPDGLQLQQDGTVSGMPAAAGAWAFTAMVTDQVGGRASQLFPILVLPDPVSVTTKSLPQATVGVQYSQPLTAIGGTPPYSWVVSNGTLPQGLMLTSAGTINGVPTTAGTSTFTVTATAKSTETASQMLSITVIPAPLVITTSTLPGGVVTSPYLQPLSATGGTQPYSWTISDGALPQGLTLSTAGAISGTPTTAGKADFTVEVTDNAHVTATAPLSITVTPPPLKVTTTSLPAATVGATYSQTLAAGGGTPPYTWAVSDGALPQGLTLSAAGALSGTPAAAGTANFTVKVTDSANASATSALSIVVNLPPLNVTTTSLPAATVGTPYSQTLAAGGGKPPYAWSVSNGALPQGLSLSAAGAIAGTPTATGNASFAVKVTDSANGSATGSLSITVNAPALTVTTSSLPAATVGVAYSQTLAAGGGVPPYTWAVSNGALPQGLTLSVAGAISGTPAAAGTANFTVKATDTANVTATGSLSIAVNPPALTVTTASLADGAVSAPYTQTLSAGGGVPPYSWTVTGGVLPPGLTLSAAGVIAGTPSAAGLSSFSVQVSDGASGKASKTLTINVMPAPLRITTTLPVGVVNTAYSQQASASGGSPPYSWSVLSGSLPPILKLSPSGAISGTPTTPGVFTFTLQASDSNNASATETLSLSVQAGLAIATPSSLSSGSLGVPYKQTMAATGGTPPYTWQIISGTLPAGLALDSSAGVIAGTPAQAGTVQIGIQVKDSAGATAQGNFSLTVAAGLVIVTAPVLPGADAGSPYSQTLQAAGGLAPYLWSVTAGSLPAGLVFGADGKLAGTSTGSGAFTFTVQATDAKSNRTTKQFTLNVSPPLAITTSTLPGASAGAAYQQTLAASGGSPPYNWSVSTGSLPPGLILDDASGTISGTPTSTGTVQFTVALTDSVGVAVKKQFSIAVAQGPSITTASLPNATVGQAYSAKLAASGGQSPYSWSITSGALPAGLALNASAGSIGGTPSAAGTFNLTVRATDSSGVSASRVFTIVVNLPTLPDVSITGPSSTAGPLQQPTVDVALSAPYPVDITGVLNLSFTPSGANGVNDPAIQFSTGGRTAAFTIPANALHAVFASPQLAVQTGSMAGMIQLQVQSLSAGGNSVPGPGASMNIQEVPAAPVVQNVIVTHTGGGFQLAITGASNTRELTQLVVRFQASAGTTVSSPQATISLSAVSQTWFQGATSAPYGGQFTLTVPFTFSGGLTSLSSVSVVLSNSVGDSAAAQTTY